MTHSHSTYARTPARLQIVKQVWEQLETGDHGVPSGGVQIRFHRDPGPCRGTTISPGWWPVDSPSMRARHPETCSPENSSRNCHDGYGST